MVEGNCNTNTFSKTICSICYEDLKPIVEDLQSISICGHVFHELCLQQWFEYCTNGKKRNCPVCKQTCSTSNAGRLYFQSIGDQNDPSLSKKSHDCEESPHELRSEVKRLEGKVLGLSSTLEQRHKDLESLTKELLICNEKLEKESKLKNEALKEKATIHHLLSLKSEDLDKSTLECMRLQERNMALAKELAAIKLVSDLNLDENEVLKLASLGNEANSKETVDVLKKSLVIRNKSYKELMTKCNTLGRGEARSQCKLEKAKEKIRKLKVRILELESTMEAKDNEVLRHLKSSKKTDGLVNLQSNLKEDPRLKKCPAEDQNLSSAVSMMDVDQDFNLQHLSSSTIKGKMMPLKDTNPTMKDTISDSVDQNNCLKDVILLDDDEDVIKTTDCMNDVSHNLSRRGPTLQAKSDTQVQELGTKRRSLCSLNVRSITGNASPATLDDLIKPLDDITPVEQSFSIRKEALFAVPVAQSGDSCFSGGLRGPDGSNWHLGKWCKKANNGSTPSSVGSKGSNATTGDLIAIGADGRGGRIKVLRSLNSNSSDIDASAWPKRCKYGIKARNSQSQIEQFFGRAGR